MVGVLKVGEAQEKFTKGNKIVYRLEKLDYVVPEKKLCPFYDVYEFCQVQNGFIYIRHHEENVSNNNKRSLGGIYKDIKLGCGEKAKEKGNKKYKELRNKGYIFTGIYECDCCGYMKRIK